MSATTATQAELSLDALLRDFLDSTLTLAQLADRYAVTLLKLVRYTSSPEFRAALDEVVSAVQDRARILAAASIHAVVKSQRIAVDQCTALAEAHPVTPESAQDPAFHTLHSRLREQSRKAANLLLRAAKPAAPAPNPGATRATPIPMESSCSAASIRTEGTTQPTSAPTPAHSPATQDLPQSIPRAA